MKTTQQKSSATPDIEPANKGNRCISGNVHKQKEYSSSDDCKDDSDEEENVSNSEIKEGIYEKVNRNEENLSNEIENQIDLENNDKQEQDTDQKNDQILFKQPKCTSASQNWLNIKIVGKEEPSSVNWDKVKFYGEEKLNQSRY